MSKPLRAIVAAGLVVGVALLALCVLANWYPPLDIVNDQHDALDGQAEGLHGRNGAGALQYVPPHLAHALARAAAPALDNVFTSRHFANIATKLGPRLDSDHRPVIADIALIE